MKEKGNNYYIAHKNLPPKLPIMQTAFWWMFLDYVSAPEWLFGVFGLFFAFVWVSMFTDAMKKDSVDIFKGD
jgi:hypothetical protein